MSVSQLASLSVLFFFGGGSNRVPATPRRLRDEPQSRDVPALSPSFEWSGVHFASTWEAHDSHSVGTGQGSPSPHFHSEAGASDPQPGRSDEIRKHTDRPKRPAAVHFNDWGRVEAICPLEFGISLEILLLLGHIHSVHSSDNQSGKDNPDPHNAKDAAVLKSCCRYCASLRL